MMVHANPDLQDLLTKYDALLAQQAVGTPLWHTYNRICFILAYATSKLIAKSELAMLTLSTTQVYEAKEPFYHAWVDVKTLLEVGTGTIPTQGTIDVKKRRSMTMDQEIIAYGLKIGTTWYYYHPACLERIELENVNNLSIEQQEKDRQSLTPLTSEQVPASAVCRVPGCQKLLYKKQ